MAKKKIILVDDSPHSLTACKQALKNIYEVFPVSSAEKMFALLKHFIPDLILLDVTMPDINGYEAAQTLKSTPEYQDIPLIFLTGMEDPEYEITGLNLGAMDYIRKPIVKSLLIRRLETNLSLIEGKKELLALNEHIKQLLELKSNELVLRQAAEKDAIRASIAKGEFLSRMSHEIRTPLNAIIGMIEIARKTRDSSKISHYLDSAHIASKHLLNLINDILDISKIEEGKLELGENEFAFEGLLKNIISVLYMRAEEKQINFTVNMNKNLPTFIISDELRLSQVITNLLTNAIKFTPKNGTVTLNAVKTEENGEEVTLRVEVADSGIGIAAEQQKRLFSPFEQANNNISHSFGGTGLGLAISKRIVELMDGKIWVESELGRGAKFIFTIKVKKGTGKTVMGTGDKPEVVRYDFSRFTLLVAEDVDINREILSAVLEETGIAVDFVENGRLAVTAFEENPHKYDLILMDVQMPEMDGYVATRAIRELNLPTAKDIIIIAMTANVFREDIESCLAAGMNDHIGKPIAFDLLYQKLDLWLHKAN